MVEIQDFPRGGKPIITRAIHNNAKFGGKKRKLPPSEAHEQKTPKSDISADYANVFKQILNYELLTADVRAIGFVKKVGDTEITLECAEGLHLTLPGNRISKLFNQLLAKNSKSVASLDEIFCVGQAIAFKVVQPSKQDAQNQRLLPKVTTCAFEVNAHLVPSNLSAGLVLNGIVSSVEEKGAVINLGLSSKINGFVRKEDLPAYLTPLEKLHMGQVALFRVKTKFNENSRVVELTGFAEADTFDDENLRPNQLMPGTILMAEPEKMVADGVYVGLKNGLKAFVRKIHLAPRYRYDPSKLIKAFRVCVLCCQQNSPLLILAAHPDTLALSNIQKHLLPEEYKIGERLTGKVYEVDKQQNVYFRLEDSQKSASYSLITAKALRIYIDEVEKNLGKFTIGSTHKCRVVGFNSVERLLIVSTKLQTLKQKIVSTEDAQPGQKYTAEIVAVKPNGLTVKLGDALTGYITVLHVRNRPTKTWSKGLAKGQKLACRALFIDTELNRLLLTAKPALVHSTDPIIRDYEVGLVGAVSVGVVVKILESGSLLVAFYNKVVGLVHASNAKKIENLYLGMPIKVRVNRVDVENRQLFLDFGEKISLEATIPAKNPEKIKVRLAKPFRIYTAKVLGAWTYGGTSSHTTAELLLNGGSIGRLHVSELDISKFAIGEQPMKEFLAKNLNKTVTIKVICVGRLKILSVEGQRKLIEEHQTTRFVECTLNPLKINELKKKLKLINYRDDFEYGEKVSAFISPFTDSNNSHIYGEINPNFRVRIEKRRLNKITLPATKEDAGKAEVVVSEDEFLQNGEMIFGKVLGVSKTRRGKCVEMTLLSDEDEKKLLEEIKKTKLARKRTSSKSEPGKKRARLNSTKNNNGDDTTAYEMEENEVLEALDASAAAGFADTKKPAEEKSPETKNTHTTVFKNEKKKSGKVFVKIQEPGYEWTIAGSTSVDAKNSDQLDPIIDSSEGKSKKAINLEKDAKLKKIAENLIATAKSEGDFEKLIGGNPNSTETWIKYIAFFVAKNDYKKAKTIAEQALKAISFTKPDELFNFWTAYLNLKVLFGGEESLKDVFARSCAATDSLKMHKHLAKAYKNSNKNEEAQEIFEQMLKKFRNADLEPWYMYGEHLLEMGEAQKARDLLQRAIKSVEKKHHISLLCRFAQLEYKHGDVQRGKTMFEKIVHSYGKKPMVWTLFIDMVLKYESIVEARKIFERAIAENCMSNKLKVLFKKWIEAEEKFGDEESQNLVKERATKLMEEDSENESESEKPEKVE